MCYRFKKELVQVWSSNLTGNDGALMSIHLRGIKTELRSNQRFTFQVLLPMPRRSPVPGEI
jgi:hypothetical protein